MLMTHSMSILYTIRSTSLNINEVKVKVSQLCPTLCDPVSYRVREILQARVLEWVTYPFSRGSFQTRDQTQLSCTAGGFFPS